MREAATQWGCDRTSTRDLVLATSEAVANAILHGKSCAGGEGIRVSIGQSGSGLHVEVWDCGRYERRLEASRADGTGGHGLGIIATVTDHFELVPDSTGTLVRFGKRRVAAAA